MSNSNVKNPNPGVLYLDADTEITEAIEQLKEAKDQEVRLVVPSRSALLQSSVNVKLLKKAAQDSKKDLVLVTNDKITKNLAGSAGLAVASSVKASAQVPDINGIAPKDKDIEIIEPSQEDQPKESKSTSSSGFEAKHISLSDDEGEVDDLSRATKPDSLKGSKSKKVPDYGKLNKRIWLAAITGVTAIVFILLYVFVPTGKVTILAKAKKASLDFNFILDAASSSSDPSTQTLAAKKLEVNKDLSFEIIATGKKEVGNKATGTLAVKNCDDVSTHSLPAGSVVTGGGKNFTTLQTATIPAGVAGGGVVACSDSIDVQITASAPGEPYNVGPTNFSIAGYSSLYKASGQTSGGSTKTVTILSAEDISGARKKAEQESTSAKDDLSKKAGDDMKLFTETIQSDFIDFNTSVPQDSEADKVNVTTKIKYTGFAAKNTDLDALFDKQVEDELKGNKQVYQNGVSEGKYTLIKQFSTDKVQLGVKTSAFYGDPIDKDAIAKEAAGKSKKDISDIVRQKAEQITGAEVETWPSLMPNMPILAGKITVDIKVSTN